jgi:[protein-PII] uridylyltransferase
MHPESKTLPEYPKIEGKRFEEDPTSAVREVVASRASWFAEALESGCDSIDICRGYSDVIDGIVNTLYRIAGGRTSHGDGPKSAVLALGGYGRREMGLATDIDLLFLIEEEESEKTRSITDAILYPFWDSGVQVGGATRTLNDCASIMGHDARALTAMMDARLIAGDSELLDGLRERIARHFATRSSRAKFIDDKIGEHGGRLDRYGGSIYMLQPNLKEGEGGLREIHTLRWVASAQRHGADPEEAIRVYVKDETSRRDLDEAHRFLWSVRHALHTIDPSSNDRLTAALQGDVAKSLGYESSPEATPAEAFMSDFYMRAERVHLVCERSIELVHRDARPASRARKFLMRRSVPGGIMRTEFGTLTLRKPGCADALTELNLFATSRRSGLPVDPITKGQLGMAGCCELTDIGSFEATRSLKDIFSKFRNLEGTLLDMHECGTLVRWFPEMAPMFHMVQHDGFHYYTAGIHSIKAVGEIESLLDKDAKRRMPVQRLAFSRIRRPHVLALATLFHDVGKGRGGDHSEKGAILAADIARRMGLKDADVKDVEFLVRSHLLMSTLAFRRDIRDPDLIGRFAQSLSSPEVLAMLYLLTYADIRAIGKGVWSEWKGALLGELYIKTHEYMTAGGWSSERRKRERDKVVSSVLKLVGSDVPRADVVDYLEKLPERYMHSVPADSIAAHILLVRDIESNPMATFVRELPDLGYTELSIVTRDSPGLFAKIAGVLASHSANVVDAQIYTSSDGVAIDVIWVTDATHGMISDPLAWSKVRGELARVLTHEGDVESAVGGRLKRGLLDRGRIRRPTEISIENDVSALHTVVEVKTDDRRGLLYTIASTFHRLDCSIDLARITTHVDRVIDVFYIRNAGGKKISSKERLDLIRQSLAEALE